MGEKIISPSVFSADLLKLQEEIRAVEEAGADWLHIDVMDGRFAPLITWGPAFVAAAKKKSKLPLDVHLMVEDPDSQVEAFAKAGAHCIAVNAEACVHLHRSVQFVKSQGCKVGVSLNPATPLETLEVVLPDLDLVTLLLVNPGFSGEKLISSAITKIGRLRQMIDERGLSAKIEADGGVTLENIAALSKAGADAFVTGSAVFKTDDYTATIAKLREAAAG